MNATYRPQQRGQDPFRVGLTPFGQNSPVRARPRHHAWTNVQGARMCRSGLTGGNRFAELPDDINGAGFMLEMLTHDSAFAKPQ